MSLNAEQLAGWVPIRIYWKEGQPLVDWCWVGTRRFTEPFFDHTIDSCLRLPFTSLFRPQTPMNMLRQRFEVEPGLQPQGLIFHMSRCGSTLVSQMLAAQPKNVVISEAGSIDAVLRARFKDRELTDERRADWLRWIVSALGQPRNGDEKSLFLKLDSWSVLDLPLIHRAFPGVPWIFLYRNPVEVLVSQLARRGAHMVPGAIEPELFGMNNIEVFQMRPEEYCARVLARICEAAIDYHRNCEGMMINYEQLPEIVWGRVLHFFGVERSDAHIITFERVAKDDAKNPGLRFAADSETKRASSSEAVRQAAAQWLDPLYEQLEAARVASLRAFARNRLVRRRQSRME